MDGLLEAADSKENERMSNLKRNGRILALLVIMGILFGTQGMTALAGTMGVGAAAGPAGGPGMEAAAHQIRTMSRKSRLKQMGYRARKVSRPADPKLRGNPDSPLPDPKFRIQRIIQQPHLTSLFR